MTTLTKECFKTMKCRSTHQSYSVGKGVLRNFAKFTEKHLRQSLFFNKVAGLSLQLYLKETLAQVFSYEFCEVTKNIFFWKWLSSMQRRIQNSHSMKSVQIRSFFSGPYFHVFGLNTDRDLLRKSPYLVRVRETKDQKKTPYLDTLLTVPVKYQRWSLFLQELTT